MFVHACVCVVLCVCVCVCACVRACVRVEPSGYISLLIEKDTSLVLFCCCCFEQETCLHCFSSIYLHNGKLVTLCQLGKQLTY